MGIVFSLNKAISIATGKYIARMDADDIAGQERLSSQVAYLKSKNLDICGTSISLFGSRIQNIAYPESKEDVNFFTLFGSPIAHPTVLGYAHIFKKNPYRKIAAEDYDLWSRLLSKGLNIGNMQASLLNYRVHENQITLDKTDIIKSSILISRQYISTYIDDDEIRHQLEKYKCFMEGSYSFKDIYSFSRKICNLANTKKVSKSMQLRALSIMFARSSSYNLVTLIYYIKAIKYTNSKIINGIDKRLAFFFFFSINKKSKLFLLLKQVIKSS